MRLCELSFGLVPGVVTGAMAALGATKFLVLVGAGLMGSVMVSNSKLADFVGDLSKVSVFLNSTIFPAVWMGFLRFVVGFMFLKFEA